MADEENELFYTNGASSDSYKASDDNPNSTKDGQKGAGKFLKGIKNGIKDNAKGLYKDAKDSASNFLTGAVKSTIDRFKPKSLRTQKDVDDGEFDSQDASIANRHIDAITGILNKTFSGDLFDAGVNTLNLLNFGSKWKIKYSQHVDKNTYPFKYIYYYIPKKDINTAITEKDEPDLLYLDTIVDPTVLGYTAKIDFKNSPLFKGTTPLVSVSKNPSSDPNARVTEKNEVPLSDSLKQGSINTKESKKSSNTHNSAIDFIEKYLPQHPELTYAKTYLNDFSEACQTVFSSPEDNDDYKKKAYKNSYLFEIKGLDKLDNPFVDYKDTDKEHESLEIVLGEDIRMYINKMAFLYRNLTWSYNMGKKLIPENRLRFNMYIKISDARNFTSGTGKEFKDAVSNGYSRVIYELKDCEFIFANTITPDSLIMGGRETNDAYATLKMKIKYRKVNRIFYSKLFRDDLVEYIIGDKFYIPNTSSYATDLDFNLRFSKNQTIARTETTNNIPVVQSLKTKLDVLKNKGLFNEDNDDTAVGRFAKSIGNKAVKAGATILDDGVQQIKGDINNFGKKAFDNSFSSSVRDLLKSNVQTKSNELGKSLHTPDNKQFDNKGDVMGYSANHLTGSGRPEQDVDLTPNAFRETFNKEMGSSLHLNTTKQFDNKKDVMDYSASHQPKITDPVEDLHPDLNSKITSPKDDVHPDVNGKILLPSEDLHPNIKAKILSPGEDLHPDLAPNIISPKEDLHPDINAGILSPSEDVHPNIIDGVIQPKEDLHPNINNGVKAPEEDVHPTLSDEIQQPKEKLHDGDNVIAKPKEDLHPDANGKILKPSENISNKIDSSIVAPNEKINNDVDSHIELKERNLNDKGFSGVITPNENVHGNPKQDIKTPEKEDFFTKNVIQTPPPHDVGECGTE